MRRPQFFRHAAIAGLAVLIALDLAATARAQHTPDPYNIVGEYNLGYQDYMYSTYPNGIGYTPNQAVLQGRSGVTRANQFQSYIEELDGVGSGTDSLFGPSLRGRGGPAEPYYRAHRQYDEVFNRVYTPNEAADKTYYKDQQARTEKYLAYLRESDPKRRAQLYREYTQQSLRAARDLGVGSARAAFRSGSAARPSASTAPSSSALPGARSSPTWTSPLRRPLNWPSASNLPASSSRARGAAASPAQETPEQTLERATRSTAPAPARAPARPSRSAPPAPR